MVLKLARSNVLASLPLTQARSAKPGRYTWTMLTGRGLSCWQAKTRQLELSHPDDSEAPAFKFKWLQRSVDTRMREALPERESLSKQ